MNLGENLGNSFEYAKKLFTDAGRLVILIILDIIPIVNWIVLGYAARVLRETPAQAAPPKLEKYGELFVDGAKLVVAGIIYMIVPIVLIALSVGSFASSYFMMQNVSVMPSLLTVLGGAGVVFLIIGIVIAFFMLLIYGVGAAHMIRTGKFGKAFAFGEILGIIRGIGWGKYIGWAIVTAIIAIVVGAVAGAIPFVGWLISAIISPALAVFIYRSLGLLYNEGAPPELRVTPPPMAGPVAVVGEKFCINCGAKIPATAAFCGTCGAKQTA